MKRRCSPFLLLLLLGCSAVCIFLMRWDKHQVMREVATEPKCSSAIPNGSLGIHMVIIPFLRYGSSVNATLERESDYKLSLRKNLAHPQVQCIHILTINQTDMLVRFKDFASDNKVLISELKSVDRARDPFDYISQNLLGKDVMYANADVYLGEGFDKVNPEVMDQQKIVYALSRHNAPEYATMCPKTSDKYFFRDLCQEYIGSHDVFLFRSHKPLPELVLHQLDF